jgi:hypothetical protein
MNSGTAPQTGWRFLLPQEGSISLGILGGSVLGILAKFGKWTSGGPREEFGREDIRNFAFMYVVLIIAAIASLWARRTRNAALFASALAIFGAVLLTFATAIAFGSADGLLPGGFFMGCAITMLIVGSIQTLSDTAAAVAIRHNTTIHEVAELRRDLSLANTRIQKLMYPQPTTQSPQPPQSQQPPKTTEGA